MQEGAKLATKDEQRMSCNDWQTALDPLAHRVAVKAKHPSRLLDGVVPMDCCEPVIGSLRHGGNRSADHFPRFVRPASHASMSDRRQPIQPGESRIGSGSSPRRRRRQIVARLRPIRPASSRGPMIRLELSVKLDVVAWFVMHAFEHDDTSCAILAVICVGSRLFAEQIEGRDT